RDKGQAKRAEPCACGNRAAKPPDDRIRGLARNQGRRELTSRFRGRSAARIAFGASSQAVAAALAITAFAAPAYSQDEPSEEQEIIVSGFAASLESAVIEKKERDQIVESISAEDIGKLPDASIAE